MVAASAAVGQTNTPEVEPNDTKAAALLNGAIVLAHGDSVSGVSTSATGVGLDVFLIETAPLPAGIYKHRLVVTSDTPGHVLTIRGLNQSAAAAAVWPGNIGTAGATDSTAQTGTGGAVQWYGFGRGEQIYFRVTGTAATTETYVATLETEEVFLTGDCGVWNPGAITITSVPPGHGNDVDMFVYDEDFNPIPGYSNDGASTNSGHTVNTNLPMFLRRHFDPGVYYIALTNFDLINNVGSPSDDNRRTGLMLDFPDAVLCGSSAQPTHLHFTMADSLGSTNFVNGLTVSQFNSTKQNPFEIRWHRFTVGGPTTGACCLPSGSCVLTTLERCEVVLEGGFQGAGSDCADCPELPAGQWLNRAPAPYTRVGAGGAMVGDQFYLLSGSNASAIRVTDCYRYDVPNDAWYSITAMPHAGQAAPQLGGISNFDGAAIGTDVYVVGGFTGPAATVPPLSRLLKYDTVLDSWEEITTDPLPSTNYGAGVVSHGGKLYVISGATLASPLTFTTACWVYDPAAPEGTRWSSIEPIPVARFATVSVVGNKIYAAASGNAVDDADRVDVYDIATDTWTQAPSMNNARAAGALYDLNGKPYAVTGGLSTYLGSSEILDGGVWSAGPAPVNGVRSLAFDGTPTWLVRSTGFNGAYRAFTEIMRVEGGSEPATGACCNGFDCVVSTADDCASGGGTYLGDDVACEPAVCGEPPVCPGDFNGDGVVDLADLLDFLGAWNPNLGQSVTPGTNGDINGDGVVDLADLLEFLGEWNPNLGQTCP